MFNWLSPEALIFIKSFVSNANLPSGTRLILSLGGTNAPFENLKSAGLSPGLE